MVFLLLLIVRDFVVPGPGRDTVTTGAEADEVKSKDGAKDRVNCGSGRDRARADKKDSVRSCESVKRF